MLIPSADDQVIARWDLANPIGDPLEIACEQAVSGFTYGEREEFLEGYGEIGSCGDRPGLERVNDLLPLRGVFSLRDRPHRP